MIKPWYDKYPVLSLPNGEVSSLGPTWTSPSEVSSFHLRRWRSESCRRPLESPWRWGWLVLGLKWLGKCWENGCEIELKMGNFGRSYGKVQSLLWVFSHKKTAWLTTVQFESTNHAGDGFRLWSLAGRRESDCLETSLEPSKTPGEHHKSMVNGCSSP